MMTSGGCSGCAKRASEQIGYLMEINNLNTLKTDLQNEKDTLLQENQDFKKTIQDLEAIKDSLMSELSSHNKKLAEITNEHRNILLQKTTKIEELTEEISKLNFDIVSIKGRENLLTQEKKNLETKVDLLTQQRDEYSDKMKQFSVQVRTLQEQQELNKKEQEKKALEELIKDYEGRLETAEDKIEALENDIKSYKKTIEGYLEKPKKNLEDSIEEFIRQYEALGVESGSQEVTNRKLKHEVQELKNRIEETQKEKDLLTQNLNKLQEKYGEVDEEKVLYQYKEIRTDKDHEFKSFYDCRILADSFFPVLQDRAWEIEFKNWENYKKRIEQASVRVSVLGYENTGKSFMISKVMGYEVPQGKQMKTTGVCVLYPNDVTVPWTALDTPGTNISIRTEFMKESLKGYFEEREKITKRKFTEELKLRMLYGDNILMESLLQEFVVNNTQVLLILVGKMRRDDQRFINRIKNQKELAAKRIIIVHNLMDCTTIEDVENIIKEDIEETFGTKKRIVNVQPNTNQYVYLEIDKKGTEHVVLAHQDSPAGRFYNSAAIQYIKDVVSTSPFSEKFDFVKAFHLYLNNIFNNYLSRTGSDNTPIKSPWALAYGETKEEVPVGFRLEENKTFELKLNFTDEFGQIRTYTEGALETVPFVAKVVKRTGSKGEERFLQVEFEVSGTCSNASIKKKLQVSQNLWVVMIKGKSENNNIREEGEEIIQSTRKFGEFLITTDPIDLGEYTAFQNEDPTITNEVSGLKTMTWKLYLTKYEEDF